MSVGGEMKIISGSANVKLSEAICEHLGIGLSHILRKTFSDGEIRIEISDSIRGCDVFVIQPTCSPVNFHLMELCLILDALKRASAQRVTAVIPYYGYARQDRKVLPRTPISAKLVADFLGVAGMNRLMTIDLHCGQIQGFFNCPVDNLYATPVLLDYLKCLDDDLVVVSPDAGGVERARAYAKRLGAQLAIVDKRRDVPNEAHAMHLIGDVQGKRAIIVDDIIDTAGTMCAAAEVIMDKGAKSVMGCASHGVFSGPAMERIKASIFSEIVVTNTIPLDDKKIDCSKLKVLSVAGLLAKAINNVHTESSVSILFV